MTGARWLDLDGTVNARDLGGLSVAGGRALRPGRLLRSDNLQDLSAADVRRLVDDLHLDTVVDLRTGVEVRREGPGPLDREPGVTVHHLSLFPESRIRAGAGDAPVPTEQVLPWQDRDGERARLTARETYLRYLRERPDSVVTALRLVARSAGATLVHCAAGKDRTGVVIAVALAAVGAPRAAIVADYVASAERIQSILARLSASGTYADDDRLDDPDHHRPRAETLEGFLDGLGTEFGGVTGWLRAQGWTEADAAALSGALVDDGI